MRLSALMEGIGTRAGDRSGNDPAIAGISEDSRRMGPGILFVAVPGTERDGHAFVADAVAQGAAAVVAERVVEMPPGVPLFVVPSARRALAQIAARFVGYPAHALKIIGFTGTFGKSSTSDVLRRLLDASGRRTGLLGSFGARYAAFHDPGSGLTTPAPPELHRALRELGRAGADTVILEVTSHALRLDRVHGLTFGGGLVAAIMPGEHIDFHRSYEDYVDAKRLFLGYLEPRALLAYDADNRAARTLAREATVARTLGFSLTGEPADLRFDQIRLDGGGTSFVVNGEPMRSALLGHGHIRNVALALTYAYGAGVAPDAAREVLRTLTPLPRRMEYFEASDRRVLDDSASHPDSVRAAFDTGALIPHRHLVVVYAIRGHRGVDINHRNAVTLADLAALHGVSTLLVTRSADTVGHYDRVSSDEEQATLDTLRARGQRYEFFERLDDAMATALSQASLDDLILLLGAQGMDAGRARMEGK